MRYLLVSVSMMAVSAAQAETCEFLVETAKKLWDISYPLALLQNKPDRQCQNLNEGSPCVNNLVLKAPSGFTMLQWDANKSSSEPSPLRIMCSGSEKTYPERQCFMVDYCFSWIERFDDEKGWIPEGLKP